MRVVVVGAAGRMGREVLKAVLEAEDMELVGAVDPSLPGSDVGELIGMPANGIIVEPDLKAALEAKRPDALVDFTTPAVVRQNISIALQCGVRPVVGTTGLSESELDDIHLEVEKSGVSAIIAPNFAIGAVLLMLFAKQAAEHFPDVEIIELHHEQKKDAPSGTAIKTAELVQAGRKGSGTPRPDDEFEKIEGARGASFDGIHIHSVRLPGFIAHQEVIMGLPGQILTIRHDSMTRESFMPGVLLALRRVKKIKGLIYGLEHILFG